MNTPTLNWISFLALIVPLITAQFFFVFLIYLTIMRRRIQRQYRYYSIFLVAMIVFLGGNSFALLPLNIHPAVILYIRMGVLFALGFPSLIVAMSQHSGQSLSTGRITLTYGSGLFLASVYIVFSDIAWSTVFGDNNMLLGVYFRKYGIHFIYSHVIQIVAVILLLMLPALLQLKRVWGRSSNGRTFIYGILLFGFFMIVGTLTKQWWIYYSGSLLSALIWGTVVYQDLHDIKSQSTLLKEELRLIVNSDQAAVAPELANLVKDLESLSAGNLDTYKMSVREILAMLTNATIDAGGDVDSLVERHLEKNRKVDSAKDLKLISEIVSNEVSELSEIITAIPETRNSIFIKRAKAYLHENFDADLSIEDLCNDLKVSRSYLMAAFKESEGKTINQYLTQLRVKRAIVLLKTKSVTQTAFEVGYNNSNYFSTVFKKITGKTPSQYQKHDA